MFYVDQLRGSFDRKLRQRSTVFMQSFIPRTLNEVYDPERDVDLLLKGEGKKLIYADTIGLIESHDNELEDEGSEDDDDGQESSEEQEEHKEKKPRGHRHEDKEAKKVMHLPYCIIFSFLTDTSQERKKAVKEESREKRKQKIPKAEKKKKIKQSKR